MIKLIGLSGWAAFQAYLKLIFYLPMIERYRYEPELTNEQIKANFQELDDYEKTKVFVELIGIAPFDDDDTLRLLTVCTDANGVPYSKSNIKSLRVGEVTKMVFEVLLECTSEDSDVFF